MRFDVRPRGENHDRPPAARAPPRSSARGCTQATGAGQRPPGVTVVSTSTLQAASLAGATLADVVTNPQEGFTLDRFTTIRKARFYLDREHSLEVDLHAISERDDGTRFGSLAAACYAEDLARSIL